MVADRLERYSTRAEQEQHRRMFRCAHCTIVAGIDGFIWSWHIGIRCRHCGRDTYLLAERGPSPYQVWPFREQRALTSREQLDLLESHRGEDGLLFLTVDDLKYYEQLRETLSRHRRCDLECGCADTDTAAHR